MTLEQLLSPAVAEWYEKFKKNLNESNTTLTPEQMEEEFDKCLIENEQLVNQSVEENKESINGLLRRTRNLSMNLSMQESRRFTH